MDIQQAKDYKLARKYLINDINSKLGKSFQVSDDNVIDILWGDSDRTLQVKLKPDVNGNEYTNNVIIIPEQEVKDIVSAYLSINIDKLKIKDVALDTIDYISIYTEI